MTLTIHGRSSANPAMVREYGDDLHLFASRPTRVAVIVLIGLALLAPLELSTYQASVLDYAGIAAIGALGLNLLTGFTGQVSLGHAFFVGSGAYMAGYFGGQRHWPFLVCLVVAALARRARRRRSSDPSRCASAATTSPSSRSGWCSSVNTCSRTGRRSRVV